MRPATTVPPIHDRVLRESACPRVVGGGEGVIMPLSTLLMVVTSEILYLSVGQPLWKYFVHGHTFEHFYIISTYILTSMVIIIKLLQDNK